MEKFDLLRLEQFIDTKEYQPREKKTDLTRRCSVIKLEAN
jgi:hypothetical protein